MEKTIRIHVNGSIRLEESSSVIRCGWDTTTSSRSRIKREQGVNRWWRFIIISSSETKECAGSLKSTVSRKQISPEMASAHWFKPHFLRLLAIFFFSLFFFSSRKPRQQLEQLEELVPRGEQKYSSRRWDDEHRHGLLPQQLTLPSPPHCSPSTRSRNLSHKFFY